MIVYSDATLGNLPIIRELAYQIWPHTYGTILSSDQLTYMLDLLYSAEALQNNLIENGHHFLLISEDEHYLGFASFEHHYTDLNITRLHKIYLLPEAQGKGIGKQLLAAVEQRAIKAASQGVSLNVNRQNPALNFYVKSGYQIVFEEDIPIGNGYLMEDYRMEKWF